MINDGVHDVPDKTIAVIIDDFAAGFTYDRVPNIVNPCPRKREWFTPNFYRCLPLTIGNQYGFYITSEFGFSATWNGGNDPKDIILEVEGETRGLHPEILTHFGSGILTLGPPFTLRTPPGVNLMTINPPNMPIPNVTVMTGVIETDNLRRNFSFNLKLQIPNIKVHFPAGVPLAGFIPIPRYFADQFELKNATELFPEEVILEEQKATTDAIQYRFDVEFKTPKRVGRHYFNGKDVYGNEFPDHQRN
jgi:hypothetical protein